MLKSDPAPSGLIMVGGPKPRALPQAGMYRTVGAGGFNGRAVTMAQRIRLFPCVVFGFAHGGRHESTFVAASRTFPPRRSGLGAIDIRGCVAIIDFQLPEKRLGWW